MKDFDNWNTKKQFLDTKDVELYYHPREVWWCYIGVNIGTEQNGGEKKFLRPVIIIRGFGPDSCLIIPLTTSLRNHPLRVSVGVIDSKPARANLSQIKVIDTNRLLEKIGSIEKNKYKELRKAVRNLF